MIKKEIIEIIKNEIWWCIKNPEKTNMSKTWKKGFIEGLRQAIILINKR